MEAPLKILVVGDPETGKTSLIKQLVQKKFQPKYKTSASVEFYLYDRLQLWDVGNKIGAIAKAYYGDACGAIIVYDVTRPSTFDTVVAWKQDIDSKVKLPNGDPLPVLLVGNKVDLETAQCDRDQLDRFCAEYGFVNWFDASAKTGEQVVDAAAYLSECVLQHDDVFQEAHRQALAFRPGHIVPPRESSSYCYY